MAEVCRLDWHIAPFRADRWLDALGAGGGEDARLRRQELVADPLDRRPARLPADLDLGEAARTSNATGSRRRSRTPATAIIDLYDLPLLPDLAHPARRRVAARTSSGGQPRQRSRPASDSPLSRRRSTRDDPEDVPAGPQPPVGARRGAATCIGAVEPAAALGRRGRCRRRIWLTCCGSASPDARRVEARRSRSGSRRGGAGRRRLSVVGACPGGPPPGGGSSSPASAPRRVGGGDRLHRVERTTVWTRSPPSDQPLQGVASRRRSLPLGGAESVIVRALDRGAARTAPRRCTTPAPSATPGGSECDRRGRPCAGRSTTVFDAESPRESVAVRISSMCEG